MNRVQFFFQIVYDIYGQTNKIIDFHIHLLS